MQRYTLPHLGAFHFVMHEALCGGVTRSLALDAHGKTLSGLILDIRLDIRLDIPLDIQPDIGPGEAPRG